MSRPLTFIPKMQEQKKEQLRAVAWIASQQEGGGYECPDVAFRIGQDLRKHGYQLARPLIVNCMRWLEDQGYAVRSVQKKKHKLFVMDADVDVPPPHFMLARLARQAGSEQRQAERERRKGTVHHLRTPDGA